VEVEITIRDYRSSDIDSCRDLWAELTQRHRDIYADQTIGGDDPGNGFDLYLNNEKLRGPWIAEVDGDIVGFTGLLVEGEEADVEPVVVLSKHRSRGIGRMLVEHAIQKAKKHNVRFLSVKPVARNVEAISFFVDAGFHILGHIDLFQDLSSDSKREWKTGITIHGNELKY
jgi:GNAT superfamily N-acetyltransferase